MQEFIPIITLKNGIRVIHEEVSSPISHFGIIVNAGTSDEPDDRSGLAHFVEHTLFKGTSKRNSYQVTKRMENAGGDLNAYTAKEETYMHASFLSSDYERAMELLADILYNATFPEKELEKEKEVVLEEINYYRDSPSELIFDEIEDIVFAGHPLGRNILGDKKSVRKLKRNDIVQFIREHYTANNLVLASVGDLPTATFIKYCEKYFGESLPTAAQNCRLPFENYQPRQVRLGKRTSQSHVMLGCPAFSIRDNLRLPFTLVSNLLGGQALSTRLNMAIREKAGLAYSVEASYTPFTKTGLFTIYIGCDKDHIERCNELAFKELKKIAEQRLGTMQLHIAKRQFLGQLAITNESKLNELIAIGRGALVSDKVETYPTFSRMVEEITAEEMMEAANRVFVPERFSSLTYFG